MAKSAFETAANDLLERYKPRCTSLRFDPHAPFGVVQDDFGANVLNLAVPGAIYLMAHAERATESDVSRVLHHSADREEFWRWIIGFKHTFEGTKPDLAEQRALKGLDEKANGEIYRRLGLVFGGDG